MKIENKPVFDADFPQYSLMKMKTRDLAMVMESELTKRRSFASFLWSLMWKEKKSVQNKK